MPPHDALERLLELRRGLERQEEMKLAVAGKRLQDARAAVQNARLALLNLGGLGANEEASGAELQAGDVQHAVAIERERHLETVLAEVQKAHRAQCEALMERTRQRKILETLSERKRAIHERDLLHREQARMDEAFLTRLQFDLPLRDAAKAGDHAEVPSTTPGGAEPAGAEVSRPAPGGGRTDPAPGDGG